MIPIIEIAVSIISLLSLFGSLSILVYLLTTELGAPKFIQQLTEKTQNGSAASKVSVVVTARNEELMIENCLNSLARQTFENMEIIVVDDSSTDSTAEIVGSAMTRDKNLRLVHAGQKPEGWVGKSWPCWRGFEESRGDFILFVDADSTFEPTVVERCFSYVNRESIDMFSISPRIIVYSVWAKTVLPLVSGAINLLYPMRKVNDPKSKRAYVFGTFILVRKSVYQKTGGHKQVRDQIVEDAAIAQLVKSSGFNLRIEKGPEFLSTEWENDLGSIFNGLERVTSTSIKTYGLKSTLNSVLLFFLIIYPIIFLVAFVASLNFNEILVVGAAASLLNIVIFIGLAAFEMKMVSGKIDPSILLYFLGGIIFIIAIITTSFKVAFGKGIYWKGQVYNQSPSRPIKENN
jgi:glycosyltransferase involved in cell wall biosynthesis